MGRKVGKGNRKGSATQDPIDISLGERTLLEEARRHEWTVQKHSTDEWELPNRPSRPHTAFFAHGGGRRKLLNNRIGRETESRLIKNVFVNTEKGGPAEPLNDRHRRAFMCSERNLEEDTRK